MNESSLTPHLSGAAFELSVGSLPTQFSSLMSLLERANLSVEQGCYEQALEAWTAVIQLQPDNAFAHLNRGGLLVELCCWSDAISAFQQAVHLQPQLKEAHYGLGTSYGRLGFFPQAIDALHRAAAIPRETSERIFHAEREGLTALALAASQETAHAIAYYTFSVESPAAPIDSSADTSLLPDTEHDASRRQGEGATESASHAEPSPRTQPHDSWAERAVAKLLAPLRRHTQPAKDRAPQTQHAPRPQEGHSPAPTEKQAESQADSALPDTGEIVPAPEASRAAPKLRSLSETLAYLQRARRQHIETAEIVVLCNQTADYLSERGQYARAEALYRQALRIQYKVLPEGHPDIALGFNNLALLYDIQRQYDKAETLYQRALEIVVKALGLQDPTTQTVLQNYSSLLLEQGKTAEAATLLESLGYQLPTEPGRE